MMSLLKKSAAAVLCCLSVNSSYAFNDGTIKFFASNNTGELAVPAAYARLIGDAQLQLQDYTIELMRQNQVEEGPIKDILGIYLKAADNTQTAANAEIFHVLPTQAVAYGKVFTIARQLANKFQQDSVAVFIPMHSLEVGDVIVHCNSPTMTIAQAVKQIHVKLPIMYARVFALHLTLHHKNYREAKVTAIEWLGGKVDYKVLQHAFPDATISMQHGKAYLVYRNGKNELL